MKKLIWLLTLPFILSGIVFAQEETPIPQPEPQQSADFGFGFSIGTVTLDGTVYNSARLMPELEFGNLGIGLDIDFRFTIDRDEAGDTEFLIYQQDWYIDQGATFQKYLNLYLSKFSYIRWGNERDNLYLRFGGLSGSNLGTGFIMGGYNNMMFLPEKRIFGGQFNLDGSLFNFPYIGVEGLVSNLSEVDLFGGRLYIRPGAGTEIPIIRNLEIGGSYFMDRWAFTYLEDSDDSGYFDGPFYEGVISTDYSPAAVIISGVDTIIPVLMTDLMSLSLTGDIVFQGVDEIYTGGEVGLVGSLLFLRYNGQIRFMEDNFQPVYFDRSYDLTRDLKYMIYDSNQELYTIKGSTSYLASIGTSFLQDGLIFNFSVEGPFKEYIEEGDYPHVKGILMLQPDVIEFVDFNFWYDKYQVKTFESLVNPEDANVGGLINFHMSPAVISLQVDAKYNPTADEKWTITSQISTGIEY